jgi:signal transduction histidine kinase
MSRFQPPALIALHDGRTLMSRGSGLEVHEDGKITLMPGIWRGGVAIARHHAGGVWIADGNGLHRLEENDTLTRHDFLRPANTTWPPQLMLETRDQALWMYFRSSGLWRVSDSGAIRVAISHPIIRCLTEDNEGNVWVGTAGGGLNSIRIPLFEVRANEQVDTIGTICEDANGGMWLGNSRGIWRIKGNRAVAPDQQADWPTFAHSICPTPDGAIWIGGSTRIFRHHPDETPVLQEVGPETINHAFALFHASDGSVWAGCETGPLLRFDSVTEYHSYGPGEGYTGGFAQVFGEDASGALWVGTRRGELFTYQGGRFLKIPTPLENTGTGILTIHPGGRNSLWLGTRGRGFLRMMDNDFRVVGPQHGLPDGIIAQTLVSDGHFWVGSSNSIFRIPIADLEACADGLIDEVRPLRFGRGDGVPGFFATGQRQPCAWQSADGRLWFVGRRGVATIRPEMIGNPSAAPPAIIDEFIADKGLSAAPYRLPSSNRRIEFRFTSPVFSTPSDLRFRYRLIGYDKEWSAPSPQGQAVYPRLPPGQYTFEVSSSTRPKSWSSVPAQLTFTVTPMWWELAWLRALAAVAALVTSITLIRVWANRRLRRRTANLEHERKLEQERARIARDLHDGIGSGLTQLGWLTAELKDTPPGEAIVDVDRITGKIRNLARDLDAAVWAVSPRHDTLGSLCSYLCEFAIEQFRRTPVRCRVFAPDDLPAGRLAPQIRNHLFMATREILNNILKHADASEVRLEFQYADHIIHIEIIDDGAGFQVHEAMRGPRHGLRNLRERLQEIGGSAEISSTPGKGTRIVLSALAG